MHGWWADRPHCRQGWGRGGGAEGRGAGGTLAPTPEGPGGYVAIPDSPAPLPSSASVSSTWGRPLSVSQEAHRSSQVCPLPLTEARYVRRSFCRRVPSVYRERRGEGGAWSTAHTCLLPPAPCGRLPRMGCPLQSIRGLRETR